MGQIQQSASYTKMFLLVGKGDHITGVIGSTSATLNISKAGAAFASTNAVIAEVGNGYYKASLTSTDTNTQGDLAFHFTDSANADPTDTVDQIVAYNPFDSVKLGLSVFPANFASLGINSSGALTQAVTSGTVLDKTQYSLNSSQTTVTIGTVANPVTSGTVLDKTGYALTQAFPANFAALAILAGGQVGLDWGNIARTATINILSGTTINTSQTVNTPASSDPWATALPGGYGAGTAGNIVGNNLDLKISSRMSSAQTVVVGTNNDKTGYTVAGTVTAGTVIDKSGYTIAGTVTTGTLLDKTGFTLTPQERGLIVSSAQSTLMTESYAAKAVAPSIAQILFEMRSHLTEKSINTTSVSLYQLDGATIWGAATLDTTTPTTIHRGA